MQLSIWRNSPYTKYEPPYTPHPIKFL